MIFKAYFTFNIFMFLTNATIAVKIQSKTISEANAINPDNIVYGVGDKKVTRKRLQTNFLGVADVECQKTQKIQKTNLPKTIGFKAKTSQGCPQKTNYE